MNVNDKKFGCLSLTVREEEGSDWVDICIPAAMLDLQFGISYPIEIDNPVIKRIEKIFIEVAKQIYKIKPFDLALIGEEVSGNISANLITYEYLSVGGIIMPKHTSDNRKLESIINQVELNEHLIYLPLRK